MKIQKVPIKKLKPAGYNPRKDLKPGDPEYEKLKRSITEFGCVELIVWNKRTGNIIGGHQRLKVLIAMGVESVEVVVVDLPLEKEKTLNLALNKITGKWDEEMLASLLKEIEETPDIDISLTGFDLPEISQLYDKFNISGEEDPDIDSFMDEEKKPITKPGDILELGKHRLICADALVPGTYQKLLNGAAAEMLHTDPPYNVGYDDTLRPTKTKRERRWKPIEADAMNQEVYDEWFKGVFSEAIKPLAEGAAFYVWNGYKQFGLMHKVLQGVGCHIACVITWVKESFALGYSDYNQQSEFCLYGWLEGNGPHKWFGSANESTVWQIKRDLTKSYIHPTQKPVALAQRAIKNSSVRGDIVLDIFLGSGSTLIAAESLGRRCYGVEIDPRYCDAIVRRYIAYAGADSVAKDLYDRYSGGGEDA
ncbi:MAG: DNA modification methylase [Candidatus Omnitrophica bacterium]|nr:DNA modification methylase [Candidatus Omnitrophota bacterium]MDD5488294.1 DNA modification methylase [Candidatus Omnitrophota bacterium]